MKMVFVLFVAVLSCHAVNVDAQGVGTQVRSGFLNGEQFLKLEQDQRVCYTMGIVDGFYTAPMFGGKQKELQWLYACLDNKTNSQMSAILTKYVQDNPGKWDLPAHMLMIEALITACPKRRAAR